MVYDSAGRYLLHLRDNRPGIWAPGEFSLLGGGREPQDRTLEDTLRRELAEEAPGLRLGAVEPLAVERTTAVNGLCVPIQVFVAPWDGDPEAVGLAEGVLLRWFTPQWLDRLRLRASTRELILAHAASVPAGRRTAAAGGAGVRRARVEDAAELTRLRLLMLASADSVPPPRWTPDCERWFAVRIETDPRFAAFVVDDGTGRLLSSAVGQYTHRMPRPGQGPHVGEIASVATDPAHRRRGHARQVVTAVHEWLTAAGCGQIHLTASPDGEALYGSLGYTHPTGPTPLTWNAP